MRNLFKLELVAIAIGICLGIPLSVWAQLPAFPGAEGFGAYTPGGRGGVVLEVTNLHDSGPGSLRHALDQSGPRTIVFRVGGTIELESDLHIRKPFLTIAGQTAPGDGIQIKSKVFTIETHDIILRGLRIRHGWTESRSKDSLNIQTWNETPRNIIIDHCSFSWGTDETVATFEPCHNITIQWCIISEGLLLNGESYSYGLLLGDDATQISVHHNLFAHNKDRNPRIKERTTVEVINNLVYNYKWSGTRTSGKANFIGNRFITGPNSVNTPGISVDVDDLDGDKIYVSGNIGPHRTSHAMDEWVCVFRDDNQVTRSDSPVFAGSGVTTHDALELPDVLLPNAGCLPHDPVDTRVINDVRNRTGSLIEHHDEVGGWPILNAGTPPADSDHDGMPDDWEIAQGLNPSDGGDRNGDLDGDGYTNLEEYLNSLIPMMGEEQEFAPAAPTGLRVN